MDFLMELIMSLILEGSFEAVGSKKLPLILRILLAAVLMGILLAPGLLCLFLGFKYQEPVVFFVGVFLAVLGILGVWALIKKIKERKNEKIPQRVPSEKEAISEEYYRAVQQLIGLAKSKADGVALAEAAKEFFERFQEVHGAADLLLFLSEERREQRESEGADALLLLLESEERCIENKVTLFLRLAEYYLELGEEARGKMYLKKLCTETVTNFEESIEIHDLGAVWEKYKPLIAEELPLFIEKEGASLEEIFALEEDELIFALAERYRARDELNQWERAVSLINELMEEINSGGFESYLRYYGLHFKEVEEVIERIGANGMDALIKRVRKKLSLEKLPATEQEWEALLDCHEPDFEREDDTYYEREEQKLIPILQKFILKNKEKFR